MNDEIIANDIRFVNYTGQYPNLCRGILTLIINGETVTFGADYSAHPPIFGDYQSFWTSGGLITSEFDIVRDKWEIDENALPNKYKKYAQNLIDIFNENVPWGCCGGCI